jgi:N utilization substance protein B
MGLRRKARELAVQTIYSLDYAETGEEFKEFNLLNTYPEILAEMAEHEGLNPDHPALAFADELVRNTIIHMEDIEAKIEAHSSNWSIDRIVSLDRSILRVAIYEMLLTNTPPAVIINEAIEIAKKFSSESSNKFVNGILDAINQEIKFKARTPER